MNIVATEAGTFHMAPSKQDGDFLENGDFWGVKFQ
jgi:hypothetical protein